MLPHPTEWEFKYEGPHHIRVALRMPSEEEQKLGHSNRNAFCTAFSSIEPSPANTRVFEQIQANKIKPSEEQRGSGFQEYNLPDGTRTQIPALSEFQESFRSFVNGVSDELRDFAGRTILTLRWRLNGRGRHQPFSSRGLGWSADGKFWHPAPLDLRINIEVLTPMKASPEVLDDVQAMVASGASEPVHHGLFREAWEQRLTNPRSALVTGMSAAEVATKNCIGALVPDAEWLAMNVPTPPLIQLLLEYLPTLKGRCTFNGKVKPPTKLILDSLRKGVTIRNKLTHAGAGTPSSESVEEILLAVHDLLWLVDYYSGSGWAINFLRDEIRTDLSGK